MLYDANNPIVKLCAQGMELEGEAALALFQKAWHESVTGLEKFTAAHYVARHQKSISDKLQWDLIALELALKISDDKIKAAYPSLYLNVGKCYEDLHDVEHAKKNYELANSFIVYLSDDGYSNMIKKGIHNAIERMSPDL